MSMIEQEKSRQEAFAIVFDAVMQHVPHDEEVLEALHRLGTEPTTKFRLLDALEERYGDKPMPLFNYVRSMLDDDEREEYLRRMKAREIDAERKSLEEKLRQLKQKVA